MTIQQPFKVGGKDFAAGHYRIIAGDENDHTATIRNLDTRRDIEVPVTPRLSAKEGIPWKQVASPHAASVKRACADAPGRRSARGADGRVLS
jgi:hypothetical protein